MKFRSKPCCLVANKRDRARNPLKVDPTRTAGLRRRLVADLRRRFNRLRSRIVQLLTIEDAFGLGPPSSPFVNASGLTINNRWKYLSQPDKVKAFKEWLRTELKGNVTGAREEELWRRYVNEGLQKGAGRAFDDVRAPERARGGGAKENLDFYDGTKDEFLRSSFGRPVAVEKVKLLASRSFDDLEAVTATMSTKIVRTLTDGLVLGKGPRDIARDMTKAVDVSRGRAETIARTEIVRAHAEGQLLAMENLGVEEVGVAVEWSTAGDERVCELCEPLQGVVLKLDEAKGMLPRHPNCRCAWIPANVGEDKAEQKRGKEEVKEAITESKGDKEDDWASGKKVAMDRPESILDRIPAKTISTVIPAYAEPPVGPKYHKPSDNYTKPMPKNLREETKAKGPDGEPIKVYMGSQRTFEGKLETAKGDTLEAGLFLTDSKKIAASYQEGGKGGGGLIEAHVYTKNPLDVTKDMSPQEALKIADRFEKSPALKEQADELRKLAEKGEPIPADKAFKLTGAPKMSEYADKYGADIARTQYQKAISDLGYDSVKHFDYDQKVTLPDGSKGYATNYMVPNPAQVYSTAGTKEAGKEVDKVAEKLVKKAKEERKVAEKDTAKGEERERKRAEKQAKAEEKQERERQEKEEREREKEERKAEKERERVRKIEESDRQELERRRQRDEQIARDEATREKAKTASQEESRRVREELEAKAQPFLLTTEEVQRLEKAGGAKAVEEHLQKVAFPIGETKTAGMAAPENMQGVKVGSVNYSWGAGAERAAIETIRKEAAKIEAMPPKLREATSSIIFTGKKSGVDEQIGKELGIKNYVAVATSDGKGVSTVYSGAPTTLGDTAHEAGHTVAKEKWGSFDPPPNSDYGKAQAVEAPVSKYGASHVREDFAEACRMYADKERPTSGGVEGLSPHEILKKNFPMKFKALRELLE